VSVVVDARGLHTLISPTAFKPHALRWVFDRFQGLCFGRFWTPRLGQKARQTNGTQRTHPEQNQKHKQQKQLLFKGREREGCRNKNSTKTGQSPDNDYGPICGNPGLLCARPSLHSRPRGGFPVAGPGRRSPGAGSRSPGGVLCAMPSLHSCPRGGFPVARNGSVPDAWSEVRLWSALPEAGPLSGGSTKVQVFFWRS
jgi:hypothetical protein